MDRSHRVGIIGFGHMHVNHVAAMYAEHPRAVLVACADTVPAMAEVREAPYTRAWNLRNAVENLGVPKVYDEYREMLKRERLDIVVCCSENAKHAEVVEACAMEKVAVCVEKPMAASLAHALRMARACRSAGTALVVNWPMSWSLAARKAKDLIDEGVIGRVLEVRLRLGHTGPLGPGATHAGVAEAAESMTGPELAATWWHQEAAGGGALLDYCCYGAMVARWYVGEPAVAAVGMRANLASQWGDADDNAALLVRFPGAMAVLQGSWTTWDHGVSGGPVVYGTEGTLVVERTGDAERVRVELGGGRRRLFECEPLPAGRRSVAEEFIHHLETGEALHATLEPAFNLETMAILDAGLQATSSGRVEMVNNPAWAIG